MALIGVDSRLFRGPAAAVAAAMRSHGLDCLQLTPGFPGLPFDEPGQITADRARRAADPFRDAGLTIACVADGGSLLDPDLDHRHAAIVRWHALIHHCRDFGTDQLVVELAPPANLAGLADPLAWSEVPLILQEGLSRAEGQGITLLVKPDLVRLNATMEDLFTLAAQLDHASVQFVMDPAAYLAGSPPERLDHDLRLLWERLGPRSPLIHARDLAIRPEGVSFPRPGKGQLGFEKFFQLRQDYQPCAPIILAHVCVIDLAATRMFVEQSVRAAEGIAG